MSEASATQEKGGNANGQQPAPGMLIVGEAASGKTTLLQQSAAKFYQSAPAASLLYVGRAADAERMKLRLPPERLLQGEKLPADKSYRSVVEALDAHSAAATFGFTADEDTEQEALRCVRVVLQYVIEKGAEMSEDAPMIVALDGLVSIAPRGDALNALLDLFTFALNAGSGFIPLITFEGFFILEQIFGPRGLDLFSRLGDIVLLRNQRDERAIRLAQVVGNTDLRQLPKGRGLLISHAGLEFPPE
jgi:hypothetical protein